MDGAITAPYFDSGKINAGAEISKRDMLNSLSETRVDGMRSFLGVINLTLLIVYALGLRGKWVGR